MKKSYFLMLTIVCTLFLNLNLAQAAFFQYKSGYFSGSTYNGVDYDDSRKNVFQSTYGKQDERLSLRAENRKETFDLVSNVYGSYNIYRGTNLHVNLDIYNYANITDNKGNADGMTAYGFGYADISFQIMPGENERFGDEVHLELDWYKNAFSGIDDAKMNIGDSYDGNSVTIGDIGWSDRSQHFYGKTAFSTSNKLSIDAEIGDIISIDFGLHAYMSLDEVTAGYYNAASAMSLDVILSPITNENFKTVSSVPVPGAFYLLGSGLLTLLGIRRK